VCFAGIERGVALCGGGGRGRRIAIMANVKNAMIAVILIRITVLLQ